MHNNEIQGVFCSFLTTYDTKIASNIYLLYHRLVFKLPIWVLKKITTNMIVETSRNSPQGVGAMSFRTPFSDGTTWRACSDWAIGWISNPKIPWFRGEVVGPLLVEARMINGELGIIHENCH